MHAKLVNGNLISFSKLAAFLYAKNAHRMVRDRLKLEEKKERETDEAMGKRHRVQL